jgi:hypothetical protein
MKTQIHNRKLRMEAKKQDALLAAGLVMEGIADGRTEPYEGWQRVCGIFHANAGLQMDELRAFVYIPGVNAYSTLSVTDELRATIRRNANDYLAGR